MPGDAGTLRLLSPPSPYCGFCHVSCAVLPQSPLAVLAEDPLLSQNVIFRPVLSCLSEVILVIYVQSLDILEKLDLYKDMYGPFVADIEFYVDGTWCDPRDVRKPDGRPCYGPPLNRLLLSAGMMLFAVIEELIRVDLCWLRNGL